MIKSITIVLVTLLAITTVAGQPVLQGAPKPVRGLAGRCGRVEGIFKPSNMQEIFNSTGLEGDWRTALGSDHRIGVHGDASTSLFHGCSATRFNFDAQNKTRIVMVTGRTSGFHPWLCDAPKGPEEYSWDGCRRYIYDDSVLLVAGGIENAHPTHRFAYLDNYAEDPDAAWNETLTNAAAGAFQFDQLIYHNMTQEEFIEFRMENKGNKEKDTSDTEAWKEFENKELQRKMDQAVYWMNQPGPYSESPWEILWAHSYGGQDAKQAYDTLYAHRCVEHTAQVTADADLRHDKIANAMRAAAKEVREREGDNEEFQEYLRNLTAAFSSDHWDIFPDGHLDNDTSNTTQLEYAQWLLDRDNDHDQAVFIHKSGSIDLIWFNKLRFFLTTETYNSHDLDYEILARTKFFESGQLFGSADFNTIAKKSMDFLPDHTDFTLTHWTFKDNTLCPTGDINLKENLQKYNAISRKEADRRREEYLANTNEKERAELMARAKQDSIKWAADTLKQKKENHDYQTLQYNAAVAKEERQKKQEKIEMEEQQKANEADEFDDDDEEEVKTEQVKNEEPPKTDEVKSEEPPKTDQYKSEEL